VFPHFIATQLPAGLAGLVLAGLFAAATSTLDSSMVTISTLVVTDLYGRFFKSRSDDKKELLISRLLMLFWGVIGIAIALLMIKVGAFLEFYFRLFSILGGSITGLFLLALFSRKANPKGAWAGIVAGLIVTVWGSLGYLKFEILDLKSLRFPWDAMMVGVLATAAVVVIGYLVSRLFPKATDPSATVLWDVFKNQ
jgi:Na+/proline symporter